MRTLKPWAYGTFELIANAENHYRRGADFDRRLALIGFDNAVEVAITTYLSLHPIQRGSRTYANADVERWLGNFHTKLDFFEQECAARGEEMACGKDEMVWFHQQRNGQYHGGGAAIPQARELDGARTAALHVFSILFDEPDAELLVDEFYGETHNRTLPERTEQQDRAIDGVYGTVDLAGTELYTSELLYSYDPIAYAELANEILTDRQTARAEAKSDE